MVEYPPEYHYRGKPPAMAAPTPTVTYPPEYHYRGKPPAVTLPPTPTNKVTIPVIPPPLVTAEGTGFLLLLVAAAFALGGR